MEENEAGNMDAQEAGAAKGGKKKLVIIIAAAVIGLLGIGGGLFASGMLDGLLGKKPPAEAAEGDKAKEGEQAAAEEEHASEEGEKPKEEGGHDKKGEKGKDGKEKSPVNGAFYDMDDMLVNLNTPGRQPRFLKISISIEMEKESEVGKLENVLPRVRDQFQVYLRELRVEDLQGSAGIYRLREELLARVNKATYPVRVKDVLFREMLIQ